MNCHMVALECGYVFFPNGGSISENNSSKIIGVTVPVDMLRENGASEDVIEIIANRMALSYQAGMKDTAEKIANRFRNMILDMK